MQHATLNECTDSAADTERPPDTLPSQRHPRPLPGVAYAEWGIATLDGEVLARGGYLLGASDVETRDRQSHRAPISWPRQGQAEAWLEREGHSVAGKSCRVVCLGEVLA